MNTDHWIAALLMQAPHHSQAFIAGLRYAVKLLNGINRGLYVVTTAAPYADKTAERDAWDYGMGTGIRRWHEMIDAMRVIEHGAEILDQEFAGTLSRLWYASPELLNLDANNPDRIFAILTDAGRAFLAREAGHD